MLKQAEGSHAVAEAVALCRPQVICAYPITPQTHIVEGLGEMVKAGELADCEFINVESEFAAMSVAIGSSAAVVRTYTATSSQGLLFMAEAVYNAAGLGLPIVMTIGNRAIGAPINIWNDHSDSMSMRDAGWIQLFAETNQEALDLHIQAFRLAEELSCPVMVCMDGFILTHAYERVDIPTQEQVDAFLPRYQPGIYEHYVTLADRLASWAHDYGTTLPKLAIAWTLQHSAVTATIVGPKRPEHVYAVAGADELRLDAAQLNELDQIVDTLPPAARAARMVVMDHSTEESHEWIRLRRGGAGPRAAA